MPQSQDGISSVRLEQKNQGIILDDSIETFLTGLKRINLDLIPGLVKKLGQERVEKVRSRALSDNRIFVEDFELFEIDYTNNYPSKPAGYLYQLALQQHSQYLPCLLENDEFYINLKSTNELLLFQYIGLASLKIKLDIAQILLKTLLTGGLYIPYFIIRHASEIMKKIVCSLDGLIDRCSTDFNTPADLDICQPSFLWRCACLGLRRIVDLILMFFLTVLKVMFVVLTFLLSPSDQYKAFEDGRDETYNDVKRQYSSPNNDWSLLEFLFACCGVFIFTVLSAIAMVLKSILSPNAVYEEHIKPSAKNELGVAPAFAAVIFILLMAAVYTVLFIYTGPLVFALAAKTGASSLLLSIPWLAPVLLKLGAWISLFTLPIMHLLGISTSAAVVSASAAVVAAPIVLTAGVDFAATKVELTLLGGLSRENYARKLKQTANQQDAAKENSEEKRGSGGERNDTYRGR